MPSFYLTKENTKLTIEKNATIVDWEEHSVARESSQPIITLQSSNGEVEGSLIMGYNQSNMNSSQWS